MVQYITRLAKNEAEVIAAQQLRYRVFVEELGAKATPEQHAEQREHDAYDPHCDHILLLYQEDIVGTYRMLRQNALPAGVTFYSANEFDLTPLLQSGQRLLELGRSCIDADHRGGAALQMLWMALGEYVLTHEVELMFGTASFKGTDADKIAQPLSCLHHYFQADQDLCPTVLQEHGQAMGILPAAEVDRMRAMSEMPPLIKSYLRLGGKVGQGAYIDHDFNTTDVLIIMQTDKVAEKYRKMYGK